MKHPVLNAEKRTVLGKKIKKLRREGLLPANVYGKGLKSISLQLKLTEFQEVYKQAGETAVVDLQVDKETHPVLIKNLQMDYFSNTPLHADFYQVNLKEKVKTMVPVELTGEPKAVSEKTGVLLHALSEIEVEALPDRIPEQFEVNVEGLAQVGDHIKVGDLKTGEGVTILTDPELTVANIGEPAKEEEPAPAAEEAAPEGEAAAEGAKPEAGEAQDKGADKSADKPEAKTEK